MTLHIKQKGYLVHSRGVVWLLPSITWKGTRSQLGTQAVTRTEKVQENKYSKGMPLKMCGFVSICYCTVMQAWNSNPWDTFSCGFNCCKCRADRTSNSKVIFPSKRHSQHEHTVWFGLHFEWHTCMRVKVIVHYVHQCMLRKCDKLWMQLGRFYT